MTCDTWREAISAVADGEPPDVDARLVEAHVARCADCRAYRENVHRLRRGTVGAAPQMPDLSRRVVKLNAIADRASRWGIARGLLAVVALEIVVLSAPALILGEEQGASVHAARHLGAFSVAYAVGLIVVAVRPARARTVLPVAATLAGALVITGVVDVLYGRAPLSGEALHIPEVISVVLVWLLAVPPPRRADRAAARPRRPALGLVDDDSADVDQRRGEVG